VSGEHGAPGALLPTVLTEHRMIESNVIVSMVHTKVVRIVIYPRAAGAITGVAFRSFGIISLGAGHRVVVALEKWRNEDICGKYDPFIGRRVGRNFRSGIAQILRWLPHEKVRLNATIRFRECETG
jgi:hypothetical protein